ncbi:MAG: hypothetical protein QNJ15_07385 [Erythrobacter sp.]|nr:hypothetical protein [Erythrobacter sp.]
MSNPKEATFESSFFELFSEYGPFVNRPKQAARALGVLLDAEGSASPSARYLLETSGIRTEWNRTLASERARTIVKWVERFLEPPVVDIYAGDLSVSRMLVRAVGEASALERSNICPNPELVSGLEFAPLDDVEEVRNITARTAILSTVLHHEEDGIGLLDRLAETDVRRWIVIENCVDQATSEHFHVEADTFFNDCLNQSPLFCGPTHLSAEKWRELLSSYGQVVFEEQRRFLPGIFLPHTLFVVDVK